MTAEEGIQPIEIAGVLRTFLVDAIPILKYVPDWMPFAGFKCTAKELRKLASNMVEIPFDAAVRKIMSRCTLQKSRVSVFAASLPSLGEGQDHSVVLSR